MNSTLQLDRDLFEGGPPLGLQRALRLLRSSTEHRTVRRVLIAVLFAWAPLAVLATIREYISGFPATHAFLTDAAVHARFLIAVPMFIVAEGDILPRFGKIACHFLSSGLVCEQDVPRYSSAIESTKRLLNSRVVEVLAFLIAYAIVVALLLTLPLEGLPAWQLDTSSAVRYSAAGLWHILVSLPLLITLLLGWIWRVTLWGRFLFIMSTLDLRLIPAHPDQCGGLRFVSTSLRRFRFLALAIASIVAGSEMSVLVRTGQPLFGFRYSSIAVIVLVVILAVGPLVVFARNLRAAKGRGIFEYGSLGSDVGFEFEQKWLDQPGKLDTSVLKVDDFSTMTDLYQVVRNVYEMKDLPFGWTSLNPLIFWAALPFVPVALMAVPLKEIVTSLVKLLF